MAALCGNVLELEDGRGLPVMAMSTQVQIPDLSLLLQALPEP